MSNFVRKSERGRALVRGTRKARGRLLTRLTVPRRGRALFALCQSGGARKATHMVAPAVERFGHRIPICTARPLLEAADRACQSGDDIRCAIYLRESIRRYLVAHCEARNIKVRPKRTTPKELARKLAASGYEVNSWILEVWDACCAVAHLSPPSCPLSSCVDVVFSVFGNDFQRDGGEA